MFIFAKKHLGDNCRNDECGSGGTSVSTWGIGAARGIITFREKETWHMQGFPFSIAIAMANREKQHYIFCLGRDAETGLLFGSMFFFNRPRSVSLPIFRAAWLILEHFETIISFGGTASTTRAPILEIPRASSGPCTPRWRL